MNICIKGKEKAYALHLILDAWNYQIMLKPSQPTLCL